MDVLNFYSTKVKHTDHTELCRDNPPSKNVVRTLIKILCNFPKIIYGTTTILFASSHSTNRVSSNIGNPCLFFLFLFFCCCFWRTIDNLYPNK